jgi:hypothetical protein
MTGAVLTSQALRDEVEKLEGTVAGMAKISSNLRKQIAAYAQYAQARSGGLAGSMLKFLRLAWSRRALQTRVREQVRRLEKPGVGGHEQSMVYLETTADYLVAVERAAALTVYQRLFSLWHVLHVPLVALLIISALYHVLAVHMY